MKLLSGTLNHIIFYVFQSQNSYDKKMLITHKHIYAFANLFVLTSNIDTKLRIQ